MVTDPSCFAFATIAFHSAAVYGLTTGTLLFAAVAAEAPRMARTSTARDATSRTRTFAKRVIWTSLLSAGRHVAAPCPSRHTSAVGTGMGNPRESLNRLQFQAKLPHAVQNCQAGLGCRTRRQRDRQMA